MKIQKTIKLFHDDEWGYKLEQQDDVITISYFDCNSHKVSHKFEIINMKEVLQDLGNAFFELSNTAEL